PVERVDHGGSSCATAAKRASCRGRGALPHTYRSRYRTDTHSLESDADRAPVCPALGRGGPPRGDCGCAANGDENAPATMITASFVGATGVFLTFKAYGRVLRSRATGGHQDGAERLVDRRQA